MALTSYFARLVEYPFLARFNQSAVYHITDDHYGAIVRALDPRRCVVTVNHGTPEIFRDELNVGTGFHFRVQRYVFDCITRAAYIVTASEWVRQHILQNYPLAPERVVCNPYGVDPIFHPRPPELRAKVRAEFSIPMDAFVLFHVGNCGPNKNIETVLQALAQLPKQIHFVQVGGQWEATHRNIIAMHHLQTQTHALGFLPLSHLVNLYCASDVFVFPSTLEGFGLPLVEAMASGLPVITSNTGTMAEVGGNGALQIDPRSTQALVNAISTLYQSADQRQRYRQASLQRATDFSWKRHAETLLDLYRNVAESFRKP